MTLKLSQLTKPMQRALTDMEGFGVLYRDEDGWSYSEGATHSDRTIKALAARKLCDLTSIGKGAAYPSAAGRRLVQKSIRVVVGWRMRR